MSKIFWKTVLVTPALLSATLAIGAANAAEPSQQAAPQASETLSQVSAYSAEGSAGNSIDAVTSVSQLTDVKPTDWAFQALESLVQRYGCIAGYPDRKFRGNQAMTRYEFAAGLNACLDQVNALIAAGTADLAKKSDLETLRKLQQDFAAELATLRGRVDALEARTATLEKQQFSTTTKLSGEVIFAISDTFGNSTVAAGNADRTKTVFQDRVRLSLDTSFTGQDRLRTRLSAANATSFSGNTLTGTNMTRLSFDGDSGNAVSVDKLYYRFAVGKNLRIQVDAINNEVYDGLVSTLSPLESSGSGSISRFGRFNPFYRVNNPAANSSTGITFAYKFNDTFRLEGGYTGDQASNSPTTSNGLFNGSSTAIAQVVFSPSKALQIAVGYARSYYDGNSFPGNSTVNLTGSTGTGFAANPFNNSPTTADTVSTSLQFNLSPKFILGGWFAASFAHDTRSTNEAGILNGAVYLAFPDLGKKGNLGAILVGMPPKVNGNSLLTRVDNYTPLHIEAFYRYRLSDNIAITPGLFVIFSPEGQAGNATQYVGTLRTTFTF